MTQRALTYARLVSIAKGLLVKAWTGKRVQYPWDEWMDGEIHVAVEGVDYFCERNSFVVYLRQRSVNKGVPVHIENRRGHDVRFSFGEDFERNESVTYRWYKGEKVYD